MWLGGKLTTPYNSLDFTVLKVYTLINFVRKDICATRKAVERSTASLFCSSHKQEQESGFTVQLHSPSSCVEVRLTLPSLSLPASQLKYTLWDFIYKGEVVASVLAVLSRERLHFPCVEMLRSGRLRRSPALILFQNKCWDHARSLPPRPSKSQPIQALL